MKRLSLVMFVILFAQAALGSQPQYHRATGYDALAQGELIGTTLAPTGIVSLGPKETPVSTTAGPVLAICRQRSGELFYATSGKAELFKMRGSKAEKVTDLETPIVTNLFCKGGEVLVVGTGKKPGVTRVKGKSATFFTADDEPKSMLDAVEQKGALFIAGSDEDGGVVWRFQSGKFTVVKRIEGKPLRSIASDGERLILGGAKNGVLYTLKGEALGAIFDGEPSEVSAIVADGKGGVFAALVDASGKLTDIPKEDKKDKKVKKTKRKPRKVKSSEVVHVDKTGRIEILWQSKAHGAYDLALAGEELLVATGSEARLVRIDIKRRLAGVWTHLDDVDEAIALVPDGKGWLVGTAHPGGVRKVSGAGSTSGTYRSPVFATKNTASLGVARAMMRAGAVKLLARTGYTKEPDETWSAFTTPNKAPRGRYAQLAAALGPGQKLAGVEVSYLEDNASPEIKKLEVLAPGWKVRATPRDGNASRSVSFSADAFKNFLDHKGPALPILKVRGGGKQLPVFGYRTIYAWVTDRDKDQLRYRFFLARVDKGNSSWEYVKEWSPEPFLSFDASTLADGDYRVRVEVDDRPTNGARAKNATETSVTFQVRHAPPRIEGQKAERKRGGVRMRFTASSRVPLRLVRCALGEGAWEAVAPVDGILDESTEKFDVVVEGRAPFGSAACEATDAAGNTARSEFTIR